MKHLTLLLFSGLLFLSCASQLTLVKKDQSFGLDVLTVESPSIAINRINEPADQLISVYLPPDYEGSDKSYPVVYYLHGFSGSPLNLKNFTMVLDMYFAEHPDKAFIMVGVDGLNKYGGSFYANSRATGNWADFLNREVITMIESLYRVLPVRESRGIAGFSMGGGGAVNNGLANPHLYGSLLASGAGLFDDDGLATALEGWNEGFERAYGTVYAPEFSGKEVSGYKTPLMDGSWEDQDIAEQWNRGFGDLERKINAYRDTGQSIDIAILCGSFDSYSWIQSGSQYFSELLERESIEHDYVIFEGGHVFNGAVLQDHVLPFFTEHLHY